MREEAYDAEMTEAVIQERRPKTRSETQEDKGVEMEGKTIKSDTSKEE